MYILTISNGFFVELPYETRLSRVAVYFDIIDGEVRRKKFKLREMFLKWLHTD